MADLSQQEFEALRAQGLSVQQISRMDPDSLRASSGPSGPEPSSVVERLAPYGVGVGALGLGTAATVAGVRGIRGAARGRVGQAIGRELTRDRGPVGALSRIGRAAMTPEAPRRMATEPGQATMPTHEEQMAAEKLRKARADADASEARRDAARARAERGTAESRTTRPKAKDAGTAAPTKKGKAPAPKLKAVPPAEAGMAEGRAVKPRHEVQYFSKSRGTHVDIEGMNQKHIEQAYRELAATNPKPGSTAARQMEALLNEAKFRAATTGIHVGHAEPRPSMAARAAGGLGRIASNPYLGLALTLLESGQIPGQMDEAAGIYRGAAAGGMRPSTRRQFMDEEPEIY